MKSDRRLSQAIDEALTLRKQMVADKMPAADIAASFEQVVRDVWPKGREWHYLCEQCSDTGLIIYTCRPGARCNGISTRTDGPHEKPGKYRRLCAQHPDSDYTHEYGEPCDCKNGSRFRKAPPTDRDVLNDAAMKPKPKPFSKFGGR